MNVFLRGNRRIKIKYSKPCKSISGSEEEQIVFCFTIYDLNGDGYISKEEMITMLKSCLMTGKKMDDDDGEDGVKVALH